MPASGVRPVWGKGVTAGRETAGAISRQNGDTMKLDARLDVNVLALQQDDEVTCLFTVEAPVPADTVNRPGETLIVVVDRSGSMNGGPLDAVRSSLHALLDRVRPQDTVGVVTFESTAPWPSRPDRSGTTTCLSCIP